MIWPFKPRFRKQIARIEISGAIAGGTRKRVLEALEEVKEKKFPALLLRIDSPGGTVGDSQEIYSALKKLQETGQNCCEFWQYLCLGWCLHRHGGSAYCDKSGNPSPAVIGVILRGNNLERLLDKVGVSFKVIKSGPYKDILSFDRELTQPEQTILQELIDVSYGQFVSTVAAARDLDEETGA